MLRSTVCFLIVIASTQTGQVALADPPEYKLDILYLEGEMVHGRRLAALGDGPAINDAGEVAVTGYSDPLGSFVFTSDGIVAQEGQTFGNRKLRGITGRLQMNNSGQIAFKASAEGQSNGIYTQSGFVAGPGSLVGGHIVDRVMSDFDMNESGQIAFRARYWDGEETAYGIFTQDKMIAKSGRVIEGKTLQSFPGSPSINDAGDVAFIARWHPVYSNYNSIFTQTEDLVGRHDVIDGITVLDLDVRGYSSINNQGDVLFRTLNSPPRLFTTDELLVDNSELIEGRLITGIRSDFNQNDNGEFVFHADFVNTGDFSDSEGLFSQNGLIVEVGDTIDGKTFTGFKHIIPPPRLAINNHGQVVFIGEFGDRRGIVLATPIPEPSAVALLMVGLIVLGICFRVPRP